MLKADYGFYGFILGYSLVVFAISAHLGEVDKFIPLVYYPRWIMGLAAALLVLVSYLALCAINKPRPVDHLLLSVRALAKPDIIPGLLLFLSLALFHGVFTSMKTMLPDVTSFRWDPPLAELDRVMHGKDPWLYLTFLDPVTPFIDYVYSKTWFGLIAISCLLVCTWKKLAAVKAQFVWTFLLCWSVLGNLLAGVFLSGGPVFYEKLLQSTRFKALMDARMAEKNEPGVISYPEILWNAYAEDRSGFGTGISAFPSLHLSMATLFVLLAFRINRKLGYASLAYLAIIMVGSVQLGWHYAVDGYFSILATFAIWKAVGFALQPRMEVAYG